MHGRDLERRTFLRPSATLAAVAFRAPRFLRPQLVSAKDAPDLMQDFQEYGLQRGLQRAAVRSKEADYALWDPHARHDNHTLRCVWYRAEGWTSSLGRRYQNNATDSREKRRRASRSKTQGDSRTDRAVHD